MSEVPGDLNFDGKDTINILKGLIGTTAPGHPDLVNYYQSLGEAFQKRYREVGEQQDLEAALQTYGAAIDIMSSDDPQRLNCLQGLGTCFEDQYHRLGDLKDLEAALQKFQEALEINPVESHARAVSIEHLAICLRARSQRLGDLQDLDAALEKFHEALQLTPQDDPQRIYIIWNLASCRAERYQHLGKPEDFEASLEKFKEGLECAPAGYPGVGRAIWNLASCFRARYVWLGDLEDLDAAFGKLQEALAHSPDADRSGILRDLAACFSHRFRRLGDLQDFEAALLKSQEAIDLTPEGHPDMARDKWNIAGCLRDRYYWLGQLKDLDNALQKYEEALELACDGHPDRLGVTESMVLCFRDRYQQLGKLIDLEAALQTYQEILDLMPKGHPNTSKQMWGLGICLRVRYWRLGDLKDLEAALVKYQEAIKFISEGDPDKGGLMRDIGDCFGDRYKRLGDLNDLELALHKHQEAVEHTQEGHPDRVKCLERLAISLQARYQRLGDKKDLQAALQKSQEAIDLSSEWSPDLVRLVEDLGICYDNQYLQQATPRDFEIALQKFQATVEADPEGEPDTTWIIRDLADCFGDRYQPRRNLKNIEAALYKQEEILKLIPEGHIARPQLMQDLASYFRDRYHQLGSHEDLRSALQQYQEAEKLIPDDHPDLASHLGDHKDMEASLRKYQEAMELIPEGHPDRAKFHQKIAALFAKQYQKLGNPKDQTAAHFHYSASFHLSSPTPETAWKAALDWASFAEASQPSYAPMAYSAAFKLLPEILWIGHSVPVHRSTLRRLSLEQAVSNAVKCCINLSKITLAVEVIEQGMATILQKTLQLKTEVDQLLPKEAEDFRRLSSELYQGTFTDPIRVMNIVNQRNNLLSELRQQPGFKYFLLPKTYDVLRYASQGGPVVILNSHTNGCDASIIPEPTSDPLLVPLPNATIDLLESQQSRLKELLGQCNVRNRTDSESTRLFGRRESFLSTTTDECFEEMMTCLWTSVVAPIYQVLESHGIHGGRLWWLPTGAFTGLPLHACPPKNQFTHSFTATLGSLLDAYAKKVDSTAHKCGIVGVPQTGPRGLNPLRGVKLEVEKITSIMTNPEVLQGQEATPDAVKHQLKDCSWIHLACHGKQDLTDPTKSHFLLYGGILELETILRMKLANAEFVFLAACQTAMVDAQLVNESLNLAGGFIAAGFRGAIGTMWSMNDLDGPLVADIVYSHLFRNRQQPQASDAAEALHMAVKELRTRKVPYERWVPFIHMGV
ncbi:CHAT domain-containing protein [Mycena latifolia]|nr:CHAT domain-containing protein [Mycena latifolia]